MQQVYINVYSMSDLNRYLGYMGLVSEKEHPGGRYEVPLCWPTAASPSPLPFPFLLTLARPQLPPPIFSSTQGIYHSGVECGGLEYAYGGHEYDTPGIFTTPPRAAPGNVEFIKAIPVGVTK
jgi:hypothetical protein